MSERQGLPSASGIERLALCPGSFRLEQGQPDTSSAESESGTRIHAWLAGVARFDTLTEEEKELGQLCETIAARVVGRWESEISDSFPSVQIREKRNWFVVNEVRVMSGQADLIVLNGGHALIIDYKTGRGEVEDPSLNLQLRALAVLVDQQELETVTVGIVQPLAVAEPKLCRYDQAALAIARQELLAILDAANAPDAPLIPGDRQCKYCRAALVCPARRQEFEKLALTTIHETGLTVSNQDLAALLDKCGPAAKLIGQIKAEAFRRAEEDPDTWRELGFEIQTPKGRSEISDIATVTNRLNEMGVPWPEITAKCKLPKTAVKDLLRPVVKGKDITLKDAEWEVLKGATEQKAGKPKLCRIGVSEDDEP
jgi:CRISPR/Cas system-associated exonuclease Cas4 (RecB family)